MQERSHAFAMKSQIWLLDPRPNLTAIVDSVEKGFQLSEVSNTPVMLELRLRSCHMHGKFIAKENIRPSFTLKDAIENPKQDPARVVLPPASFAHEQEKIQKRWPAAVKFIKDNKLNEFLNDGTEDIGIAVQGGLYNIVIRALQLLGLSDVYGNTKIPLYVMNVTYPVIDDEIVQFAANKKAFILVEEGQPDYIEQNLHAVLRRADVSTKLHGKDFLPVAGEYTPAVVTKGLLSQRMFMAVRHLSVPAARNDLFSPRSNLQSARQVNTMSQQILDATYSRYCRHLILEQQPWVMVLVLLVLQLCNQKIRIAQPLPLWEMVGSGITVLPQELEMMFSIRTERLQ